MQIKVKLRAYKSTHAPAVCLSVNNGIYYNDYFDDEITEVEFGFTPEDQNVFEIEHYNKQNSDTITDSTGKIIADCAVELVSLTIDGFMVPKNILFKKPFYVKWPSNLVEDAEREGRTLPEYIDNNLFFGFNGTYRFDFPKDFAREYYWYYWQMERDANSNLQMVDESTQTAYFDAYGLRLAINQDFSYTIHDLKYIIENETLPTDN